MARVATTSGCPVHSLLSDATEGKSVVDVREQRRGSPLHGLPSLGDDQPSIGNSGGAEPILFVRIEDLRGDLEPFEELRVRPLPLIDLALRRLAAAE